MFEKVRDFMKGVWRSMFPVNSIENALNVEIDKDTIMGQAVTLWANMYSNNPPWLSNTIETMGLPVTISSEIARLVTLELKSEVTGSTRGDYLNKQYQKVIDNIRIYTEYACAKGGLVLKPYVDSGNINVEYVQADYFYPVKYGSDGTITAAAFVEQKQKGSTTYTRLEYHDFNGESETITNKAFKSSTKDSLGNEISLQSVDEWQDLQPVATISGIDKPMFSYFKMPLANNLDTYSPLGRSVYGGAVDLIKEADKQYSRGIWEYQSAERAIDIDETAFTKDSNGEFIIPESQQRLFRKSRLDNGDKAFYEVYSPTIRDEEYRRGLNSLLRLIEFNCGLSYGTLSDAQETSKTATEVKQSKQRSYAAVSDIQKSLRVALDHLVYIMDVYTTLYSLAPSGAYDVSYVFDDSIVIDAESERARDIQEMHEGILSKIEYRMKWYGEDEKTAAQAIQDAKTDSMADIIGYGGDD